MSKSALYVLCICSVEWIHLLSPIKVYLRLSEINSWYQGIDTLVVFSILSSMYQDNLPDFSSPLVWTYPDGAWQLWRGAPRRRAPNPPLESVVNQCFFQIFEQHFSYHPDPHGCHSRNIGFWFLVCYAATQLATQLPKRRIQVVRSSPKEILHRCRRFNRSQNYLDR